MTQLIQKRFFEDPFKYLFEMDRNWNVDNGKFYGITCDIKENGDHLLVQADLPGIKKEDIHVDLKEHVLKISAERKVENDDAQHLLKERFYGKYERSFRLPESIDEDKIQANFNDGVLEIKLSKKEKTTSKTIQIS
jgi:HSP20 family protein